MEAKGQREEWRAGVRVIDWQGLPVDDKLFGWLVGRSIGWLVVCLVGNEGEEER